MLEPDPIERTTSPLGISGDEAVRRPRPMSPIGPSRQFQRLTISVAIGEQRTWLELLMVPPGRE